MGEGWANHKSFGHGPKGCGKKGRSADEGKGHKYSTLQERTVNLSKTAPRHLFQRGVCTKGSACAHGSTGLRSRNTANIEGDVSDLGAFVGSDDDGRPAGISIPLPNFCRREGVPATKQPDACGLRLNVRQSLEGTVGTTSKGKGKTDSSEGKGQWDHKIPGEKGASEAESARLKAGGLFKQHPCWFFVQGKCDR